MMQQNLFNNDDGCIKCSKKFIIAINHIDKENAEHCNDYITLEYNSIMMIRHNLRYFKRKLILEIGSYKFSYDFVSHSQNQTKNIQT